MTGALDENALRFIEERLKYHRNLKQRKEEIIRLIDEQGKLTPELQIQIEAATKMVELDDIYLPYRPKRKTRASTARARGLQPLADYLWSFPASGAPLQEATSYIGEEIHDTAAALQGAMDIVAEEISEDAELRGWIRDFSRRKGLMVVKAHGLVHISELADRYVRHPMEVVSIGDQVTVTVLSIDHDRGKVSLSMKR